MPALPIIDLLIFLGWTTLASGGVLKAIHLATSYRPRPAGLAPGDLMMIAMCFLLLSLALSARSLVRRGELDSASRSLRNGQYPMAAPSEMANGAESAEHAAARIAEGGLG
jgi:hypothetical protein